MYAGVLLVTEKWLADAYTVALLNIHARFQIDAVRPEQRHCADVRTRTDHLIRCSRQRYVQASLYRYTHFLVMTLACKNDKTDSRS